VAVQEIAPGVEGFGLNAQGEMAWPAGTVRRQLVAPQRGFGQESEQDTGLANLEEDVTARLQAIGGKIEAVAARHRPDNQEDLEKFAGLSLEFERARGELQRCVAESQRLGALSARLARTYWKLEEVLVLWLDAFLAGDDEDGGQDG
jgi:hypothetical protein